MPAKSLLQRGKLRPLGIGSTIPDAIASRRLLEFRYGGHSRIVEPHTYGIDPNGGLALVAFQVEGGSQSGEHAGWKTFREGEMRNIVTLERHFSSPRPEYRHSDGAFVSIISQL